MNQERSPAHGRVKHCTGHALRVAGPTLCLALLSLAFLVTAVGCASGPWTPDGFDSKRDDRGQVLLIDDDLRGILRVDDIAIDWTEDGRLWAKAKIRNRTDEPVHLLVRTTFLDHSGNAINEANEWQTCLVRAFETYSYEYKSLEQSAVQYLIEVDRAAY